MRELRIEKPRVYPLAAAAVCRVFAAWTRPQNIIGLPRDHAPFDVPIVGRVGKLVDQPLLDAGARIVLGQHQFGVLHPSLEARIARQPDEVAHV